MNESQSKIANGYFEGQLESSWVVCVMGKINTH